MLTENGNGEWQRITTNSNLSANQLVSTWSVNKELFYQGKFIDTTAADGIRTLIKLNSDGTFRYEEADIRFAAISGIKISRSSGTWEYTNSGLADGFLILKNQQGQTFSIGTVNWSSDRSFFRYVNRSEFDQSNNKLVGGKIERFQPTDLRID